jgi:hypothetical protein
MNPFDLPEDISTLSAEDLAAWLVAAIAERDRLFGLDAPTPADVEAARTGVAAITQVQAEATARESAGADMAALRGEVETAANGSEDEDPDDENVDDEDAEGDEPEDEGGDAEDAEGGDDAEAQAAADAVTASGRKRTARQRLAGRRPANVAPSSRQTRDTIVASAGVRGFSDGAELTIDMLVEAVNNTIRSFPTFRGGSRRGQLHRSPTAVIRRDFGEDVADGSSSDLEMIERVANEKLLKGGNLVAAGGWCAPSEQDYNLIAGETTDGLIDLPEFGVKRGGIKFTAGPDFSALYSAGFTQTEAQNIAGTTKPCYTVPCPAFSEERLDAMGLCVKAGLLQDAAWPELTKRVIAGALVAHKHYISAALITKMVAKSSAAISMANTGSVASNLLDSVEVLIETLRGDYRLGFNQTLEVVFPHWVLGAVRADLAARNGVDMMNVTDQQINSWFATRKARPQWVYNWQMLVDGQEGYPATVDFMVYPAGTFTRGSADIITLDSVYDAASLSVNEYTGLFTEEGVLLAQRGYKSKLARVQVGVTGRTGANDVTQATPTAGSFTLVP